MNVPPPGTAEPATGGRPRPVGFLVFVAVVVSVVVTSGATTAAIRSSREASPAQVVHAYLQALADGDATRALSYGSATPVETTLLTDAVLASSEQQAPIRDISTSPVVGLDDEVDVHYRQGEQAVADRYTLARVGGRWKLDRVTNRVNFVPVIGVSIPVLVNGVAVDGHATETFPGTYHVTTGLTNIDWGAQTTATVTLQRSTLGVLEPRMTPAGDAAFVVAAKKRVAACTSQHLLAPVGCPFGFLQPSKGPAISATTVRWTVKGDPWVALSDPQILTVAAPGEARASTAMTFSSTCTYATGKPCPPRDITTKVILAGDATADPLTVDFALS